MLEKSLYLLQAKQSPSIGLIIGSDHDRRRVFTRFSEVPTPITRYLGTHFPGLFCQLGGLSSFADGAEHSAEEPRR